MRARSTWAFAPLVLLGATSCVLHPTAPDNALCVSGFHEGQTLAMTLLSSYDAASNFDYEPSLVSGAGEPSASCNGVDGISAGSQVSFSLVDALWPSGGSDACTPWFAYFQPEAVSAPHLVVSGPEVVAGVTIAASFAQGTIGGRRALVGRTLYTPSKNPSGMAVPRQLPPLVVSRWIDWEDGGMNCYDIWVASW